MGVQAYLRHFLIGIALLFLAIPSLSSAATISGNIYDLSLEKVKGAIVEVNTTPQQYLIATEGRYSLEIQNGTYLIKAEMRESGRQVAGENRTVTILQEGTYVMDFILFPDLEGEEEVDIDVADVAGEKNGPALWIALILFALAAGGILISLIVWKKRLQNQEIFAAKEGTASEKNGGLENDDLGKLLGIIGTHGGRTTQKVIRKEMPLSEAKISLLLSELEHKGLIEKIKKGRGNIVVLKR